jgi:hypothetical protein
MVTTKDISYLARQMAQQKSKYIFWLGAGMSLTAGIPTSVGVVDRLIDRYWCDSQVSAGDANSLQPYFSLSESAQAERVGIARRWALANLTEISQQVKETGKAEPDWGSLYSTCLGSLPGEEVRQQFIVECIKEGKGRLNLAHLLMAQLIVDD